jgi:hypothetical protein
VYGLHRAAVRSIGEPSSSHLVPLTVIKGEAWIGSPCPSVLSRPSAVVPAIRTTRIRIGVGTFLDAIKQRSAPPGSDMSWNRERATAGVVRDMALSRH